MTLVVCACPLPYLHSSQDLLAESCQLLSFTSVWYTWHPARARSACLAFRWLIFNFEASLKSCPKLETLNVYYSSKKYHAQKVLNEYLKEKKTWVSPTINRGDSSKPTQNGGLRFPTSGRLYVRQLPRWV